MSYLTTPSKTPQRQPVVGKSQIQNAAGGYVFAIDKWSRLQRFFVLGSEGGTYYASQEKLTAQNTQNLQDCIEEDGARVVSIIVDMSVNGRAAKQDPILFALALCASYGKLTNAPDEFHAKRSAWEDNFAKVTAVREAAYQAIPQVCRTASQLFMFIEFVTEFRGEGRGLRRALSNWYTSKDPEALAYQVVKYRNRNNWTHRDVLRIAHPQTDDPVLNEILKWITHPDDVKVGKKAEVPVPKILKGYKKAAESDAPKKTAELVRQYGLTREMVRTEHMTDKDVLAALLENQPVGAMVRNLAANTRHGVLTATSASSQNVVNKLTDAEQIEKSRIHPIQILAALLTYKSGRSLRGDGTWVPVPVILDALDEAFYLSFGNVQATGKSRCIALDVSPSMNGGTIMGIPGFTPRVAAAAMAMTSIRTGDPYEVLAFSSGGGGFGGYGYGRRSAVTQLALSKRQRLDDVIATCQREANSWGGTDCALPMIHAKKSGTAFDIFEIYTDNDTHSGSIHPFQALKEYRKASGINAKLAVIACTSTGYSIADPSDAGTLDVVGFDTSTPNILAGFAEGIF